MGQDISLKITGPAYEHRSKPTNFQRCVNQYVTDPGPDGRGSSTLIPVAGSKSIYSFAGGNCRGAATFNNTILGVWGNKFYRIAFDAAYNPTVTEYGTLDSSTGYVSISNNTTQFIIVDSTTTGYIWTINTGTFVKITDPDFPGGKQVQFIDSYFAVNAPGTQDVYSSAISDGLTWDAADRLAAEANPDTLVGLGKTKGELWLFGNYSIQVAFTDPNNTGPGSPFSIQTASNIDMGCSAPFSIVSVNGNLIWLDSRRFIAQSDVSNFFRNQSTGYNLAKLSTEAIDNEIAQYSTVGDAIASTYVDRGHVMYEITFPTANKTWVLDLNTSVWHEKSWYDNTSGNDICSQTNFYFIIGSKIVASSIFNNKLYIYDAGYKDNDGTMIRRIRTSPIYVSNSKLIGVNCLEVKCNTGQALVSDPEPVMSMRFSNDSGFTWSDTSFRSLGKIGQYNKRLIWNQLGTGYEWIIELEITDAVEYSIIDATANIDIERF